MQVQLFRQVDISNLEERPVELSELGLKTRLTTSLRLWAQRSSLYVNIQNNMKDKELRERMAQVEEIKLAILHNLSKDKSNSRVRRLRVPREIEDYLDDVLNSSEFLPFKIHRVKENGDYLLSFPDLPIILIFEDL